MAVLRAFNDRRQYFDANGNPLSGGFVFWYLAGTTTKQNTHNSSSGATPNANPMTLDSAGRFASEVWLTNGSSYKMVITASTDTSDPPNSPIWTEDNIDGINETTNVVEAWIVGPTPVFVSSTQFTLSGDQTATFTVGRRVRVTDSGGTKYGTIKTSAFTTLTTITLDQGSNALASPLSAVSYGIDNPTTHASPLLPDTVPLRSGSGDESKQFSIELDGLTTATTRTATVPDSSGIFCWTTETNGSAQLPPMFIQGTIASNNVADAANDLDFTAGACRDATNARNIVLSAMTKRSDAAWAVGTNQGMLDTGVIGNNDYYVWAILRSDTGVSDIICSLSSTSPTMPASYDHKRLVGWFKRVGGAIVAFDMYEISGGGVEYIWDSPTLDINLSNTLTTTRRTDAVKVPLTFSTVAHLNAVIDDAGTASAWIYCPDQTDLAPSLTGAPLANINTGSASADRATQLKVRTSSTGTIAARADAATVDLYAVSTIGFEWARRN